MMDKISIGDIRAKFPMYSDMADDELLISIRKKYYPDMPPAQFYSRVQYTAPDPTEGMSFGDKLIAGVGKGMADVARGVGQAVGAVSRSDIEESRRLDAPLMRTGAGMAGDIIGTGAALLPSAFIPGAATIPGSAAIGAATGFLSPSASTEETLKNTAIGGAIGPAAIAAGRGINALWNGGKALLAPFTKKGQEEIAANTLRSFAGNPEKAAASISSSGVLVPGSRPTMAQASGDFGLAQLERTLRNNPQTGPAIAEHLAAQRAARLGAVQDIAGTDAYYKAIKEGRAIFAAEDYAKAMFDGIDKATAESLGPQIKSLLERPSIQMAKREAVRLAKEQNIKVGSLGSIEGLDWLKKGLDSIISNAKSPGSSIGKERLRAMVQTKQDLMSVIEDLSPAYKAANDNFAAMSRQVNSMDTARMLLDKMQTPLGRAVASGREMKNEYAKALESALETTKKATGMDLPASAFMPKNDLQMLQNVAKDMGRAANAEDIGRAVGSNTAQNLAAQNLLRMTLGPTGLPQSWSESVGLQSLLAPYTGIAKMAGAENAVMNRLSQAAMNPEDAATLLLMSKPPSSGLLGFDSIRYAPVMGRGLLSYSGE